MRESVEALNTVTQRPRMAKAVSCAKRLSSGSEIAHNLIQVNKKSPLRRQEQIVSGQLDECMDLRVKPRFLLEYFANLLCQ